MLQIGRDMITTSLACVALKDAQIRSAPSHLFQPHQAEQMLKAQVVTVRTEHEFILQITRIYSAVLQCHTEIGVTEASVPHSGCARVMDI